MDKIYLNGLEFYGYHGVFPEETKLGQRFLVDLILLSDLKEAGQKDDITLTVDYGKAYNAVKSILEGEPKKLVEAVAEEVASVILDSFERVTECYVKVIKPNPPIPGHYTSIAIEIRRSRNEK